MTMTPYEIRLELIKVARDLLSDEFHSKKEAIHNEWDTKRALAFENKTELPPHPNYPKFFTEDDIIVKATRLNEFISNGK